MSSQSATVLQKLTFLVLLAILASLVVIIIQNGSGRVESVAGSAEGPAVGVSEEPESAASPPSAPPEPQPARQPLPRPVFRATSIAVANAAPPSLEAQPVILPSEPSAVEPVPLGVVAVAEVAAPAEFIAAAATSATGSIMGRVTLRGTPPPEVRIDMGGSPFCARQNPKPITTRHYIVSKDKGLANVLVYVKSGLEDRSFPISNQTPLLEAVNCLFEPYVQGVRAGQPIRVRNSDLTFQNVHATPTANREFNFAMPVQGQENQIAFQNPELFIRVKDDVHAWMFAYISVLPHPFFAITDKNGNYELPAGLPPGNYVIAARHLKAGEVQRELSFQASGEQIVNFILKVPVGAH